MTRVVLGEQGVGRDSNYKFFYFIIIVVIIMPGSQCSSMRLNPSRNTKRDKKDTMKAFSDSFGGNKNRSGCLREENPARIAP